MTGLEKAGRRNFLKAAMIGASAAGGRAFAGETAPADERAPREKDVSAVIGDFAANLSYDDLSEKTQFQVKEKLLDAIACGIGAIDEKEIAIVRNSIAVTPEGASALFGGGRASPPDAALLNASMTRYLDYMDSYLGPHGGGHPGDCLGPILACAELSGSSTENVLAAIAVAYEVVGAFADVTSTRDRGWDHLTYVGIAMAAGAGKALQLSPEQMREAVGLMAASVNPLRVTRAEQVTMWKGFAAGFTARNAVYAAVMARNGMEGPRNPFNGTKGWNEVVAGEDFELTFTPGERIHEVWTKLYLAETYVLPATEAAIELSREHGFAAEQIEQVNVRTFHDAILNAGPAEGRDAYNVTTKAEADHSLPYMVAVALIDKQLSLAQYTSERIASADVQTLLRKVRVEEEPEFTRKFVKGLSPVTSSIEVVMKNGERYEITKEYFSGHPKRPATKEQVREKFVHLSEDRMSRRDMRRLAETVENLEKHSLADLMGLLP